MIVIGFKFFYFLIKCDQFEGILAINGKNYFKFNSWKNLQQKQQQKQYDLMIECHDFIAKKKKMKMKNGNHFYLCINVTGDPSIIHISELIMLFSSDIIKDAN